MTKLRERAIWIAGYETQGSQREGLRIVGNLQWQPATATMALHNMALNLAPFGRWTLRDNAAQHRLGLL